MYAVATAAKFGERFYKRSGDDFMVPAADLDLPNFRSVEERLFKMGRRGGVVQLLGLASPLL